MSAHPTRPPPRPAQKLYDPRSTGFAAKPRVDVLAARGTLATRPVR